MEDLKNTLMALASSAEVQDSLYHDFVAKRDELVLDYDEALNKVAIHSKLTEVQKIALRNLETYIEKNAGEVQRYAFSGKIPVRYSIYTLIFFCFYACSLETIDEK